MSYEPTEHITAAERAALNRQANLQPSRPSLINSFVDSLIGRGWWVGFSGAIGFMAGEYGWPETMTRGVFGLLLAALVGISTLLAYGGRR